MTMRKSIKITFVEIKLKLKLFLLSLVFLGV